MISRRLLIISSYIIMALISFILVLAGLVLMLQNEEELLSYNQVITDLDQIENISSLKSFNPGDIINVKNKVDDIYYFQFDETIYKIVVFDGFKNNKFQLCLIGNQGENCSSGLTCNYPLHVKSYNISGQEVIWLEEWYNFFDIFFGIETYLSLDFDKDIKPILNELSQNTNQNDIKTLTTGLSMDEITGYTNPEKTIIEYLAITIRPKAGIKDLELDSLEIVINYKGNTSKLQFNDTLLVDFNKTYTSVIFNTPVQIGKSNRIIDFLNDDDFGVIILRDVDNSIINNYTINRGDKIITLINITKSIPQINGLPPNSDIITYIEPAEGIGDEYQITSPSNYPIRIVKF